MPKDPSIKRVLVVGSGPIVIGQAAEFDYAGSQACRALKEEGVEVVLVNSNPATIMTDYHLADRVYLEPLTAEFVARVIAEERPDALLPGLGGQTGLNLARELSLNGVLQRYGVRLLGTPLTAIERAEDRELFKETMAACGEAVPPSQAVASVAEAQAFAARCGFPLIVRPAYTLGGSGGGRARNRTELTEVVRRGLRLSPIGQVLVEKSLEGWKEIEYEVMRDAGDNCITVCNMENLDPMGIHTGDSVVVAPSQTLTNREYQLLRTAALKIIRTLGIVGGCNIQFALDPQSERYYVIEVNPRVSRSSALASKATGYPIAKVTAKVALGLRLDEIKNPVTGGTWAAFEPALDYVVVKVPRWPFDKFKQGDRRLGTQMKATGEVMALDRTLEGALLKAIRSLEVGLTHPSAPALEQLSRAELAAALQEVRDDRLLLLFAALRRGFSVAELAGATGIDPFFLGKLENIVLLERELAAGLTPERLARAKRLGFSDAAIARLSGVPPAAVRRLRAEQRLAPAYKMVDTCAAEFRAATPYYYSTYAGCDEVAASPRATVAVLGSGPIRIGQGIEFDYCSVQAVWAARAAGYETVLINNNPETVSTDFDTADRLYFEPLHPEDVRAVLEKEQPAGIIAQFGGQTALNLAVELDGQYPLLGTAPAGLAAAEDRELFDALLARLGLARPAGGAVTDVKAGLALAERLGFPVLVRPSFVLGGRGMEVVVGEAELRRYLEEALAVSPGHPLLIDRYLPGKEIEVDALADGEEVTVPGIMEHIERAGIHSGDSIAVYPARLTPALTEKIVAATRALARGLQAKGLINIQFVYYQGRLYVIEANPRASRTVPFLSKVTGLALVPLATRLGLGARLSELGLAPGLVPPRRLVAVKAPVFSFGKLTRVDPRLGPEMKSTGEVLGLDRTLPAALYKALLAAGQALPAGGTMLLSVADRDKEEVLPAAKELTELGWRLSATPGTARYLAGEGLAAEQLEPAEALERVRSGEVHAVVSTPSHRPGAPTFGFTLRRLAVEYGLPCYTCPDTLRAALLAARALAAGETINCADLNWYLGKEDSHAQP
ncbi:MAG TPA: carbamoyl-phosphate synthase large subunit [Firmicutes bacterium]|nr:carbamoyl-phosphate synthase large subunit [Bacillota bacterium]